MLHDGFKPFPGVIDALERLIAAGKRICILSNAPRRAVDVIQRMSEGRIFQSVTVRAIISYCIGGLLGLAAGFAMAKLGIGGLLWPPIIGLGAGLILIRGVRSARSWLQDQTETGGSPL